MHFSSMHDLKSNKCMLYYIRCPKGRQFINLPIQNRQTRGKKKMKEIGIRSALKKMGATDIQMKDDSTPACPHEKYGFFTAERDSETFKKGLTYYFSYSPRHQNLLGDCLMYRVVKDRKDFHGETNQRDFSEKLAKKGFKIAIPK